METIERLAEIVGGLRQLRIVMVVFSLTLLLISFFYTGVTLLEGVALSSFSLFILCQKEFSPLAYRYFMIVLLTAMIFDGGSFLQYIGEKNVALSAIYIIVKALNVTMLFVMLVIVWRHLQFYQLLTRLQIQQSL